MSYLLRDVSPLPVAFGGAAVSGEGGGYGFGQISETDSIALLREAFDRGLRIFDSAPVYGFGMSEQRIGKAFKHNREDVFLVSKCGVSWDSEKNFRRSNDAKTTQAMLEQSLRDLDSDYIDLYMVHWPSDEVDIRVPIEVMAKAKQKGQIRHLGLCNTSVDDLKKAKSVERIEAAQSEFHLFQRGPQAQLFDYLMAEQISFMSWGTLDKGILTRRVDRAREKTSDYDGSDIRGAAPPWWDEKEIARKLDALEKVWPILDAAGHSGLEMALGHNLAHAECTVALVGARTSDQLDGVFRALEKLPDQAVLEEILAKI